jgi:hypothetical protein
MAQHPMPQPDPRHATVLRSLRLPTSGGGLIAGLFLGAVVGVGVLPGSSSPDAFGSSTRLAPVTASVPFAAQGLGVATREVELRDHPVRGRELARLAAGTVVPVGGVVRVPAGLASRDVYWVRFDSPDGVRYGFVARGDVELSAGTPPTLDVRGLDIRALLAPADGVRPAGVGSGSGATTEDTPVQAQATSGGSRPDAASACALSIGWLPDTVRRWEALICAASAAEGIDPDLLAIVALVESGGNSSAGSHVGAQGLMQVMPATAVGIAAGMGAGAPDPANLLDPETSLRLGARYLVTQMRSFSQNDPPEWQATVEKAAAAYNAGPGALSRAALPLETQRYVTWVGGMWRERHDGTSPTFEAWMAAGGARLVAAAQPVAAN